MLAASACATGAADCDDDLAVAADELSELAAELVEAEDDEAAAGAALEVLDVVPVVTVVAGSVAVAVSA